mmetsp:Transcript_10715/g.17762  ORF Transcript_10715/g.17762 Transcript_10715/m.17762 type:complete len:217 (+) Transcript_10715:1300-1950(+)
MPNTVVPRVDNVGNATASSNLSDSVSSSSSEETVSSNASDLLLASSREEDVDTVTSSSSDSDESLASTTMLIPKQVMSQKQWLAIHAEKDRNAVDIAGADGLGIEDVADGDVAATEEELEPLLKPFGQSSANNVVDSVWMNPKKRKFEPRDENAAGGKENAGLVRRKIFSPNFCHILNDIGDIQKMCNEPKSWAQKRIRNDQVDTRRMKRRHTIIP